MSKPVSNAEIEDVLSSIRRLVSENAGAQRRERTDPDRRDRLVLTPAFRVDGDAAAPAQDAPEPDAARADADDAAAHGDTGGDMADDDLDSAVAVLAERLSAAQIIPDHAPETEVPETGPEDGGGADTEAPDGLEDTAGKAVAGATEAHEEKPDDTRSLELRIAELEAAVDNTAGDWEPDGSEAEDRPERVVFHHHAAPDAGASGAQAGADGRRADPEETPDPAPFGADAETPQDHDALSGDTPGDEDFGGDPWEDVVVARPDDAHAFGDDDIDDAEVLEEESVIDEAILRDYVAQMVREELQGPIGERITHNVRRMVRREIARALALRDME